MKYEKISDAIFKKEISKFQENLDDFCDQSRKISEEIKKEIKKIDFNK